ncbi:DUF4212 domain-containing protein [Ottowia sp.]|uniref:DUF4212 domain-containing protein n=1 Tax=Ottowia sp. TaxID=1898956 RepID=UPI0039E22668
MQPADDLDLPRGVAWVRAALLALWAAASFGVAFFARDIDLFVARWPLNFWLLAQGGVLVFLLIVMAYAWVMNRADRAQAPGEHAEGDGR